MLIAKELKRTTCYKQRQFRSSNSKEKPTELFSLKIFLNVKVRKRAEVLGEWDHFISVV